MLAFGGKTVYVIEKTEKEPYHIPQYFGSNDTALLFTCNMSFAE
jgi:hypothetical protein